MAHADVMPQGLSMEHIGPRRHTVRNLAIGLGIATVFGTMWLAASRTGEPSDPAAAELGQIREAMFNRCGDPAFQGPADVALTQRYSQDGPLRQAIIAQYHNMQRGSASCEEILQGLRSAGYPLR